MSAGWLLLMVSVEPGHERGDEDDEFTYAGFGSGEEVVVEANVFGDGWDGDPLGAVAGEPMPTRGAAAVLVFDMLEFPRDVRHPVGAAPVVQASVEVDV
jgi:hypothetical protein